MVGFTQRQAGLLDALKQQLGTSFEDDGQRHHSSIRGRHQNKHRHVDSVRDAAATVHEMYACVQLQWSALLSRHSALHTRAATRRFHVTTQFPYHERI